MQQGNSVGHGIPFGWHVEHQRMVTATEVSNGRSCGCICAACGKALQARQGSVRIWHFAHDEETDCQKATEAAIHRMAKQMIVERACVYVPGKRLSRTIYGEMDLWRETIEADVQLEGLQPLADCVPEKTLTISGEGDTYRRPDIHATLDGRPLAIEILNTHAVDAAKLDWLKQQGLSILEIEVTGLDQLPPDQIAVELERRLFQSSLHTFWLHHTGESAANEELDRLEAQIREQHREEDLRNLAEFAEAEARQKLREEARQRFWDVEEFKFGVGRGTVRVGRNEFRVSLKIHGHVSDPVFEGVKQLAHRNGGRFNSKGRKWEFHHGVKNETLFKRLSEEVQVVCLQGFQQMAALALDAWVGPQKETPKIAEAQDPAPRKIFFEDPGWQEVFDERAGILEIDAGFARSEAEALAFEEVSQMQGCVGATGI